MMPVMPQDDYEGHLDELDIFDDLLNSLSDPSDQESHGGSQEPCDQEILDPGPSRPGLVTSPWTVDASDVENPELYSQDVETPLQMEDAGFKRSCLFGGL